MTGSNLGLSKDKNLKLDDFIRVNGAQEGMIPTMLTVYFKSKKNNNIYVKKKKSSQKQRLLCYVAKLCVCGGSFGPEFVCTSIDFFQYH